MKKSSKKNPRRPRNVIPYGRQSVSPQDQKAVQDVLRADFLTQGPKVSEFEAALARYCNVRFVVAFSSGTAALHAAAAAAGMGPGDVGMTSAISFAASANCFRFLGSDVVFADIDPHSAQMTAQTVQTYHSHNIKSVICVDFTGRPSEMGDLWDLARQKKFTLIVDAAHSFGGKYKIGKKEYVVGSNSHSHLTCFSFHPVKTMTTGEGGAVTTNDPELYERLSLFRTHGITKDPQKYIHQEFASNAWYHEMQSLGFNYRITDFQCALGLSQMKRVNAFVKKRARIAARYKKELKGYVGFINGDDATHTSAHHLFPVLVDPKRRDEIFKKLRDENIFCQVHYLPIYRHPYYAAMKKYDPKKFPNAENYFRATISLPIFPDLTAQEQGYVIKTLKKIL